LSEEIKEGGQWSKREAGLFLKYEYHSHEHVDNGGFQW
jgi:hypothetical protein